MIRMHWAGNDYNTLAMTTGTCVDVLFVSYNERMPYNGIGTIVGMSDKGNSKRHTFYYISD